MCNDINKISFNGNLYCRLLDFIDGFVQIGTEIIESPKTKAANKSPVLHAQDDLTNDSIIDRHVFKYIYEVMYKNDLKNIEYLIDVLIKSEIIFYKRQLIEIKTKNKFETIEKPNGFYTLKNKPDILYLRFDSVFNKIKPTQTIDEEFDKKELSVEKLFILFFKYCNYDKRVLKIANKLEQNFFQTFALVESIKQDANNVSVDGKLIDFFFNVD